MQAKEDASGWRTLSAPVQPERLLSAMAGASMLTRRAADLAFQSKARSTTTPDILQHLGEAFQQLFETEDTSV